MTQSLEYEIEEMHRTGKYNGGNAKQLKVRMRSHWRWRRLQRELVDWPTV